MLRKISEQQTNNGQAPIRLTESELHGLLKESMKRHDAAQQARLETYGIEDALKIARELDVPVEHVYAAAEEWRRKAEIDTRRAEKRATLKRNQRAAASIMVGMSVFTAATLGLLDPANFLPHALIAALPLPAAFFVWCAPVTDADVDRLMGPTE